ENYMNASTLIRLAAVGVAVTSLAACTKPKVEPAVPTETPPPATGPQYPTAPSTPVTGGNVGAAMPGSEQDFVVNVGDRIYFDLDSYSVRSEAQPRLDAQAAWLARYPQPAHVHRTLLHLGEELLHGVMHFDGRLWRTLPLLIVNPGRLTREWVQGKRTRYVSPLAMFLFTLFVMFFALSFMPEREVTLASLPQQIEAQKEAVTAAEAAVAAARKEADLAQTASQPKLKNPDLALYKLQQTIYKFAFLLVPLSIPFVALMFLWKRGFTLYDHGVFVLYSLTFMSLLLMAVVVVATTLKGAGGAVGVIAALIVPVHMFAQVKGAYSLSTFSALWRTGMLLMFCTLA
uniref:ABC2_membrane domain-containing protein n=1 Tax=Parastrongyloides trichosuri TaxID=131310 RepID=A0A0N4ZDW1_PARTI